MMAGVRWIDVALPFCDGPRIDEIAKAVIDQAGCQLPPMVDQDLLREYQAAYARQRALSWAEHQVSDHPLGAVGVALLAVAVATRAGILWGRKS